MALPQSHSEDALAKGIEDFLMTHEGVLTARAWLKNGGMFARVTVHDSAFITANDLQTACRQKFGIVDAPRMILIERAGPDFGERAA